VEIMQTPRSSGSVTLAVGEGGEVKLGDLGLSLVRGEEPAGVRDAAIAFAVNGTTLNARFSRPRLDAGAICGQLEMDMAGLHGRFSVEPVPGAAAVVLRTTLINDAEEDVLLQRVTFGLVHQRGCVVWAGGRRDDLRFAHTDNVRTERYPYCQGEFPYLRPVPVRPIRLGEGHDQPFPALLLTDREYRHGLVLGAASQNLAYPVFTLQQGEPGRAGVVRQWSVTHDWRQNESVRLIPGRELELDGIYIQLLSGAHPQDAYNDYVAFLSQSQAFRGENCPLLDQAMHCTWNYGVWSDQFEEALLRTAEAISRDYPRVRWFLMDAGYLAKTPGRDGPEHDFLDRFYTDPDAAVDREKFPRGLSSFAESLRRMGLRPGIWITPTVHLESELSRDRPEWLLRRFDGRPYVIGEHNGYLDWTHPEAYAWLDRLLRRVIGDWGFQAIKLDFWSQNFEDHRARLHDANRTAVQARDMFLGLIRKHLGPDGVLVTCCATGMGNPFIGRHADAYRNTHDIGAGTWPEQVRNCFWALPTLLNPGRRSLLLNNDSVGVLPEAPDHENDLRLTWSFMHMGMIETGGRLEELEPRWSSAMRKLTDRCERGFKVRCPDEGAFTGEPLPSSLFVTYPSTSRTRREGVRQSVAVFNWTERPKVVAVARQDLGHRGPVTVENFWTAERDTWDNAFVVATLSPRSARLWDVIDGPVDDVDQ
jgi:hypothetical protein